MLLKDCCPCFPGDPEVTSGEEAGRQVSGQVVHPTLRRQLVHHRVHSREPDLAVLPPESINKFLRCTPALRLPRGIWRPHPKLSPTFHKLSIDTHIVRVQCLPAKNESRLKVFNLDKKKRTKYDRDHLRKSGEYSQCLFQLHDLV